MNFVDHRMTLDINSPASNAAVSVKKGDTARRLLIHLVQDGYPYHIDEDCFAVFTALKPDGTKIRNACTVEECEIAYKLTPQTVAVEGEVECEIRLYSAEETLLTSSRFFLLVNPTVYNEGDEIESTDEFDALTKLVAQTLILKDVMEEAADRAQEQAAQAADSADQALTCAVRAENAASTAENASRSAEGSAANAMGSEESARQFASEAQSSAAQAQSNAGRAEELVRKAEAAAGTAENAARIAEGSEVNARGSEEASRAYAAQAQESAAEAREYAAQVEHPDALPNPYPLILTGAVNAEYDGTEAVSVEIPEPGRDFSLYGLGTADNPLLIPSDYALASMKNSGWYSIELGYGTVDFGDGFTANKFLLRVESGASEQYTSVTKQTAMFSSYPGGEEYVRYCKNGYDWTAWERVVRASDIPTDEHINGLINTALAAIPNAAEVAY